MSWSQATQAVLGLLIVVGSVPLIRRRRNRMRHGVLPPPSALCKRGSDEHLLDKPTRSIP